MVDRVEATGARGRILLAEDEPHIRRLLATLFESAGFEVVSFADGAAAIDAVVGDEPADLIVTDLVMPGASGLDVLQKVRELPHRKDTPVVMLTAKGQDVDREAAFSLGADEFMTKPFSPKKLLARIDEILSG